MMPTPRYSRGDWREVDSDADEFTSVPGSTAGDGGDSLQSILFT